MRGTRIREGKAWYEKLSNSDRIDRKSKVSIQLALSALCILLGENDEALSVLLAAEQAVQPIGGYDLAVVIGNLAVQRDRMGRYEESKEAFERCCGLFREFGSPWEEALALLNFGVAKLRLDEPIEESAALYRLALECARKAGSTSMQAKAHSCLAHVEKLGGRYEESLNCSRIALKLWQDGPYLADCALELLGLSETLLGMARVDASATALHIAERLEELSHSPFPSRHRTRCDLAREALKLELSPGDWRAVQRLTKSKSAPELVTMAIQLIESVTPATQASDAIGVGVDTDWSP
jgi:tetratricopeptide (TPR) repeat protein